MENQTTWPLQEVGERAVILVQEYLELCNPSVVPRGPVTQVRWFRPPEGVFKVNFDGALFENVGYAGIGVSIRDSEGEITWALSQRIPLPFSVEMAEAMAARQATLFVQEMSLSKVMMEGDCLSARLVQHLKPKKRFFKKTQPSFAFGKLKNAAFL